MAKPRELRFNAFNMTAPSHNWAGLWSHPRDTSINYNSLDYWVDYARTAERGLLDGIFLADVFGVYDVFGDSPDTAYVMPCNCRTPSRRCWSPPWRWRRNTLASASPRT